MTHAVICGGGAIGLLTALLLARRELKVTIVERDEPVNLNPVDGNSSGWQRPGVAHAVHAHVFHARISRVLEAEVPEVVQMMTGHGIGQVRPDFGTGYDDVVLMARRPVFESVLRRAAREDHRINWRHDSAHGYLVDDNRVIGLQVTGGDVIGDLVIDAGGKRSQTPRWLAAAGVEMPPEERYPCDLHYFSRHYRLGTGSTFPSEDGVAAELTPYATFLVIRGDNDTFAFTGAVSNKDPLRGRLRDPDRFEALLGSLPVMAPWLSVGHPITDVTVMAGLANRRRTLIRDGNPVVRNLVLVGDALLYTNATFGQGIALGAWQAQALARLITDLGVADPHLQAAYQSWVGAHVAPRFDNQVRIDELMVAYLSSGVRGEITPHPLMTSQQYGGLAALGMSGDAVAAAASARYNNLLCTGAEIEADPAIAERLRLAATLPAPPPLVGSLQRAEFEHLLSD
jgi:2-polyprenyl-6-methoxyphenol hydroxylase-like FAD-dependent oxidoreductase